MKLYFSAILETLIALSVKYNKKIKEMGDILHPSNNQDLFISVMSNIKQNIGRSTPMASLTPS